MSEPSHILLFNEEKIITKTYRTILTQEDLELIIENHIKQVMHNDPVIKAGRYTFDWGDIDCSITITNEEYSNG